MHLVAVFMFALLLHQSNAVVDKTLADIEKVLGQSQFIVKQVERSGNGMNTCMPVCTDKNGRITDTMNDECSLKCYENGKWTDKAPVGSAHP